MGKTQYKRPLKALLLPLSDPNLNEHLTSMVGRNTLVFQLFRRKGLSQMKDADILILVIDNSSQLANSTREITYKLLASTLLEVYSMEK